MGTLFIMLNLRCGRARLTLGREDGSDSLTLKGYTAGVSGILVIDSGTLNMYSDVKLTGHMAKLEQVWRCSADSARRSF